MTRNCTVALLLLGISGDLAAQTLIRVPQDKQSIQAGIDAANNGDTVLVTEGTYVENIVITKKITLAGLYASDGDTSHISKTVIDGSNPRHVDSASVVTFGVGTDTTSLLMGFTIRGGRGISAGGTDWVAESTSLRVAPGSFGTELLETTPSTRRLPGEEGSAYGIPPSHLPFPSSSLNRM